MFEEATEVMSLVFNKLWLNAQSLNRPPLEASITVVIVRPGPARGWDISPDKGISVVLGSHENRFLIGSEAVFFEVQTDIGNAVGDKPAGGEAAWLESQGSM